MDVPASGQSPNVFNTLIAAFVDEKCIRGEDGELSCVACGSVIEKSVVLIVLHYDHDCADNGKEIRHPLPYCPKCEKKPKAVSVSIHV